MNRNAASSVFVQQASSLTLNEVISTGWYRLQGTKNNLLYSLGELFVSSVVVLFVFFTTKRIILLTNIYIYISFFFYVDHTN